MIVFAIMIVTVMYGGFVQKTHIYVEGSGDELIENVIDAFDEGQRLVAVDRGTYQELNHMMDCIYDNPDLFWVDMQYNVVSVGDVSILVLKEKYHDVARVQQLINMAADRAIADTITNDMSEYDKVLAIHDWICENVEYEASTDDSDQDIYGALVLGKARCAGYAKAFTYLLDRVGIKSQVISGDSIDRNGISVPHAWNLIYIDNQPYYFDITWDDDGNSTSYDWFGITSIEFFTTHFPNVGYEWEDATSTDANYYVKNGMYLTECNIAALAKQIQNQGLSFSVKCANRRVLNDTIESFGNKSDLQLLMKSVGLNRIERISYVEDSRTNCLHVSILTK
jgi:hypothetical protein